MFFNYIKQHTNEAYPIKFITITQGLVYNRIVSVRPRVYISLMINCLYLTFKEKKLNPMHYWIAKIWINQRHWRAFIFFVATLNICVWLKLSKYLSEPHTSHTSYHLYTQYTCMVSTHATYVVRHVHAFWGIIILAIQWQNKKFQWEKNRFKSTWSFLT